MMVKFPDSDTEDDPPNRRQQPESAEMQYFEEKLGAAVVRHLDQAPAVRVWMVKRNCA
jgi:hypothetical protein